jgi:uncharacterized protein (DUF433 family)
MSGSENNHAEVEEYPLIAFAADTAAAMTGLSVDQLQRWDRIGLFTPWRGDSNRRRPHSRIYSYDDVIALRTIARLRQTGVSFAQLKPVIPLLAPETNPEWPVEHFYVVGSHVFLSENEAGDAARGIGQGREPLTISRCSVKSEIDAAIEELRHRTQAQIGEVTRNRGILHGAPVVAGTRIPTSTIAWFHENGYSLDWILAEFPRLTREDVRAALDFERNREAVTPDPVLAKA